MGSVRMIDEQETIKYPSAVSGCVGSFLPSNYKKGVDTIFYKIHFNL
jgi:hypothetical protein